MYYDDGDPRPTDTISHIGYAIHPWTGGINNSFSYKGVTMSFLIDYKFGGDIYSGTNARIVSWGLHKMTLEGRTPEDEITVEGVTLEGTPLSVTHPWQEVSGYWSDYHRCSEYFIYDASFVKLRQMTLGYSLPMSLLERTPFNYVNVAFVGRNLLMIYKDIENVDPESMYTSGNDQGFDYFALPHTRSFGFNLRVRF
jgi:hypothetical protein